MCVAFFKFSAKKNTFKSQHFSWSRFLPTLKSKSNIFTSDSRLLSAAVVNRDGSGTQNLVFGFWKSHGEMGLRQVEQGLSSFFAKILVYLMIFLSGVGHQRCCEALKKHMKYAKNLAKNK